MDEPVKGFAEVDFLYELNGLRSIKRYFQYAPPGSTSSVAEHTLRVVFIAMMLARKCGADELKVLKLALAHDVTEIRTGDPHPWQKPYVQCDAVRAARDMLAGTGLEDLVPLIEGYEKRDSLEAQLVKDADMIDTELEMRELAEMGSRSYDFFSNLGSRQNVLERMRTDAGRELFKQVQQRRPLERCWVSQSSLGDKHGT